jgi:hypothetical protein
VADVSRLFRLPTAVRHDPAVTAWFREQPDALARIARHWFDVMRGCGDEVRETLHDDQPTACVNDAAFGYVDAFTAHVNVGFFLGAHLEDPARLLEGSGKFMRHVKLKPGCDIDDAALTALIRAAYSDVRALSRS